MGYFFLYDFVLLALIAFLTYKYFQMKKLNRELQSRLEEEIDKYKTQTNENKLIAIDEILENIAHQWRQPLVQINSSVLLIDDALHENNFHNKDVEERLLEIESLTKYLSDTINDFKDFCEHDKAKRECYLKEIVEKSLHVIKWSLKESSIEVVVNIEEDFKYYGYDNELQQVILVILNNAKDALINRNTFMAKITIEIEKEDDYISIKICDNAGGMTKKIRDKIFEPYFTTKHKSQGTGLGLYMSKKIIEKSFDGSLSVNNSDEGVCFEIKLKVVDE